MLVKKNRLKSEAVRDIKPFLFKINKTKRHAHIALSSVFCQ